MQLEFRTPIGGTIKDLDESERQVLTEFPHDVLDTFKTTFGADAFRDSFARRMPAICWQHDLKEPIGRTISAQVTHRGNEMIGQLSDFDSVPLAKRAFTQMGDGSLTDTSFGFVREADERHPEIRGATRITKASMKEWSPVTIGSIPGAVVTGTRAGTGELILPTFEDILRLREAGVLSEDEARQQIAELPEWRERINLGDHRAGETDESRSDLASAVDAALDEATVLFATAELDSLPEEVRQAIALVSAAGTAVDELLDAMGIEDPDYNEQRAGAYKPAPYHSDGTDAVMCPKCGKGNAADAAFCDQCGDHMTGQTVKVGDKSVPDFKPKPYDANGEGGGEKIVCPSCGKGDDNDAHFCDQCGTNLVGKMVKTRSEDEEELETRDWTKSMTVSKKPWSDFKPGDYTPAQWKASCLIWSGSADSKDGGSLPVLEPDGTPNANAMAAAAGRINQTKASDIDKVAAARKLLSMYGKAKMQAPGALLGVAHGKREAGEDDLEMRALEAEQAEITAMAVFERRNITTD